jgi:hypothetical protein
MLINKTTVRKIALAFANERANRENALPDKYIDSDGREWNYKNIKKIPKKQYTQVSPAFFDTIEAKVRNLIMDHINSMPRGGKTLR